MNAICRLYSKNNPTTHKTVNIDDSLYEKLYKLLNTKYDATISDLVNVAIENYANKNKPTYYAKPEGETVTYRSFMIRKNNVKALDKMHSQTGISFARLFNAAIKDFLDNL